MASTVRISPDELVGVLSKLAEDENLNVTIKQTAKGSVIAGTGAAVGGLLGGPIGIAVGATVGGLCGAYMTSGTFKPVHTILQELSPVEREKLFRAVTAALGEVNMLDAVALAALILTDQAYKQQIIGAMMQYFQNEMQITD